MKIDGYIKVTKVAQDAIWAFWNEVAKAYPEIEGGDLSIRSVVDFDEYAEELIKEWLQVNRKVGA
jgi:hypothetical protein